MNKDQFLFRGNRIDNGEVVEGYFGMTCRGNCYINTFGNTTNFETSTHSIVHPDSVNQFSGLVDKSGIRIFSDDIRIDHLGVKFRIYQTVGGFVVKSSVWSSNLDDLVLGDELVTSSLSDPQTAGYIYESTVGFSNVWDEKLKTEKV